MANAILERFSLPGKVAVVTGGGDGIGRAACLHLSAVGASIAVFDKDSDSASAVAETIVAAGGNASSHSVDVTDEGALRRAFDRAATVHGRLDVLVNNAGIVIRSKALEMPLADWNSVIAVNLTGMFLAARIAARHMIQFGKGGIIVNTASVMGFSGGLFPSAAYQASKGGVVNLTRALALEWVRDGIRVNAVAPTYVRTSFIAALIANPDALASIEAATPMGRLAEVEEVADAILFLSSPAAAMITGVILPVDGGFLAR